MSMVALLKKNYFDMWNWYFCGGIGMLLLVHNLN